MLFLIYKKITPKVSKMSNENDKDSKEPNVDLVEVDKELKEFEKNSKMGRPLKSIDIDNLDSLCELGCTRDEIASFFRCHPNTIDRRVKKQFGMTFGEYYALKEGRGLISLRRTIMQVAQGKREVVHRGDDGQEKVLHKGSKPNTLMLLHLAKTRLGLSEKIRMEHSGPDGTEIKFRNKTDDEVREELDVLMGSIKILQEIEERKKNKESPNE